MTPYLACHLFACYYGRKFEKEVEYVITNLVKNPLFADAIKTKIGENIDTKELDKKLKTLKEKLHQAETTKTRIEKQMDELPYDDPIYDRKICDLQKCCDKQYDTMLETEKAIEEVKLQLVNIREKRLSQESIYNVLLAFDDLYDSFEPMEKKLFFRSFLEKIEIFPQKRADGTYLKKLVFNFPIPSLKGNLEKEISLEYSDMLETCCLLEHVQNAKEYISFTLDMEDYYRIKDAEKSQGGLN